VRGSRHVSQRLARRAAFGSYLTYVTQCGIKHRTAPHVTYIRAWFRAAGSGPLTYLPPAAAAGRGNTSARTDGTQRCDSKCPRPKKFRPSKIFWTENGLCAAPSELRNVSISCCDIAGFSVMTVAAARRLAVEPMRARAARACGGRTPPLQPACARLLTYPPSLARWLAAGLTYLPPLFDAALT